MTGKKCLDGQREGAGQNVEPPGLGQAPAQMAYSLAPAPFRATTYDCSPSYLGWLYFASRESACAGLLAAPQLPVPRALDEAARRTPWHCLLLVICCSAGLPASGCSQALAWSALRHRNAKVDFIAHRVNCWEAPHLLPQTLISSLASIMPCFLQPWCSLPVYDSEMMRTRLGNGP